MMSGPFRHPHAGSRIDRRRPIPFTFDGRSLEGCTGDTLASALLACGVRVVGRSFKFHRPRGIWGAGVEDPNGIVDVEVAGRALPNCRATTMPLVEGMALRSVNTASDAARDRHAFLDRLRSCLSAGFYYKTFIWPSWSLYESRIRRMAGLGRLNAASARSTPDCRHDRCDVLVVGGGAAGLCCALSSARRGLRVILVDDQASLGGALSVIRDVIDGASAGEWLTRTAAELAESGNVTVLLNTTAFGIYDALHVGLVERLPDGRGIAEERLWHVRAERIVLATGAIEKPLVFPDNDRPGVMSAFAALTYIDAYGVMAGRSVVVATGNDSAYETASRLSDSGADVIVLDSRPSVAASTVGGIDVQSNSIVAGVKGSHGVEGVQVRRPGTGAAGWTLRADALLVSGGWTPTLHLYGQAGGKPRWDADRAMYVPGALPRGLSVIGAANGTFDLPSAMEEGRIAGEANTPPRVGQLRGQAPPNDVYPLQPSSWIDMQSDVTTDDVMLAARENFTSAEHLKRYTTLGMATDQGKTSNVNGLAVMAKLTGRTVPEMGLTTDRPPYTPVSLETLAGLGTGELMNPLRRLPAESVHREAKATMGEYGGWLRPARYGHDASPLQAIEREVLGCRQAVSLFDASSLGKIEVLGPDAAALLDFISYNRVSALSPGQIRYGFILLESGAIFDDGVVLRLAEDRFLVSCSSSHTTGVVAALEEWRQDRFDRRRVHVHDVTASWGTLSLAGPAAKRVLIALATGVDPDVPHMSFAEGRFEGQPCRVARVSFTGERSYEVSVPSSAIARLWRCLMELGRAAGIVPLGVEGVSVLRAEKGFLIVGRDTDGTTMPHDVGFPGPRLRRQDDFVGKRSLFTDEAMRFDRRQLVSLEVATGSEPLGVGAHAIERQKGRTRSIGFVTTSHRSPTLGRPVALALLEAGASRHGDTIEVRHLGSVRQARIAGPCAFDPEGERLHV